MKIQEIKKGDFLSEESHYEVLSVGPKEVQLKHYESNTNVIVSSGYIKDLMSSANEVTSIIGVTKEDKKNGTVGIRTIFENISGPEVFTVCFKKQDKEKSKKAIEAEIEMRSKEFSDAIEKAKSQKKGVANVAKLFAEDLIKRPILTYEVGEDRVLKGYKVQFTSRDGHYKCMDMEKGEIRPVNINTIKWLILRGTKYVVE